MAAAPVALAAPRDRIDLHRRIHDSASIPWMRLSKPRLLQMKLAVLSSHPIQYQAPLFRRLAREPGVQFTALFCHDHGVAPSFDAQFGRVIQYDVPLLEGYSYRFLWNVARRRSLTPMGQINPQVIAMLAGGEFDIVVVHGYAAITNLLALWTPRRRTRVLMRGESHLLRRRTFAKRIAKQVFLRSTFARVDHFLPIGTLNRAYYSSYGVPEGRMTLAPYSVDNIHFAQGSADAQRHASATRARLGLPPGIPMFLFCAKIIAGKRPFDALHAFALVRARVPCGLAYVGDGDLAPALSREIVRLKLADSVFQLGFRNQTELPRIYGACDVLVLPSVSEPWGLVVNEAMAAGMVAVVSDQVGAGPDLVDPDCIFPTGEIDSFAAILQRFATRSGDLADAKRRAAARIKRWGIEETAGGFLRGAEAAFRT
jgi:glycosyltransferase involved in cell wall biosynthesis